MPRNKPKYFDVIYFMLLRLRTYPITDPNFISLEFNLCLIVIPVVDLVAYEFVNFPGD